MRARLACVAGMAIIVASCGASTTPSTTAPGSVTPHLQSAPPTAALPGATPEPMASSLPTDVGRWETAGMMAVGRLAPHALVSGGQVLVLGNDTRGARPPLHVWQQGNPCVRDDSQAIEIWDRQHPGWTSLAGLNKPRADFAAVPLPDGRVLVTGGVNAGIGEELNGQYDHSSYSSTYIYDGGYSSSWSKGGLLSAARTAPVAATLPDGHVLVAGGYYLDPDASWGLNEPADVEFALATDRRVPSQEGALAEVELADIGPEPPPATALATAELYDPATDTWSPTGSLRFARYGAPAVTLSDGRVLVVGSELYGVGWDDRWVRVDARAGITTEIYDPASGRFTLTGELPSVDWTAVTVSEPYLDEDLSTIAIGSLVALADGGALLVGRTEHLHDAFAICSLRFSAASGAWTEIDRVLYGRADQTSGIVAEVEAGHSRLDQLAAITSDGQVLLAGGAIMTSTEEYEATADAVLFDPATGRWTALPPMPEPRAGGAAVSLGDGAVLLVGGYTHTMPEDESCSWGATGLTSTVLFVPESGDVL